MQHFSNQLAVNNYQLTISSKQFLITDNCKLLTTLQASFDKLRTGSVYRLLPPPSAFNRFKVAGNKYKIPFSIIDFALGANVIKANTIVKAPLTYPKGRLKNADRHETIDFGFETNPTKRETIGLPKQTIAKTHETIAIRKATKTLAHKTIEKWVATIATKYETNVFRRDKIVTIFNTGVQARLKGKGVFNTFFFLNEKVYFFIYLVFNFFTNGFDGCYRNSLLAQRNEAKKVHHESQPKAFPFAQKNCPAWPGKLLVGCYPHAGYSLKKSTGLFLTAHPCGFPPRIDVNVFALKHLFYTNPSNNYLLLTNN